MTLEYTTYKLGGVYIMNSLYMDNLIGSVLKNSSKKDWDSAILEWDIDDVVEDANNNSSCICGKEKIRYLYTIKNKTNGNILFPIGSSCIKKFERVDLNEFTSINEKLFKLFHAVKTKKYINLDSELFSRKLLEYMFNQNMFEINRYNNFDSSNDYKFMLKMFNKRSEPSINEQKKINAIIKYSLYPQLEQLLIKKIIDSSV